jgi:chloride channel protein, CIC family
VPSSHGEVGLSRGRRALERLKSATYLRKWLVLGTLIGIVAGLGAVVFIKAVGYSSQFFLNFVAGYRPPAPVGEGNSLGSVGFSRPWAIPLVVGLGGLLSGVLVFRFAPEAEGHGTDAAIEAVHRSPKGIRPLVVLIKIVASAITIGSGGSAGREGPTAQISAGFGSFLARQLDLSLADARIAVTVGIGAGIGAIFRAPLGGAVLGAEILYREDIEAEALLPSIIASIVGFSIFGAFEGFTPIFGFLHGNNFHSPIQLLYYALLGLAAGAIGLVYIKTFYGLTRLIRHLPGSRMVKPAIAGVLVGGIGLLFPEALGTGYGWIQQGMQTGLPRISLVVILLLPLARILATSLSIGSGGSGGIFGPGMVIGGFLGLGVWRVLEKIAPGMPSTPVPFMVVGMIACFGSVSHAYLALMLMVAEMTGSLALLPPAMIALGLAALVVGDATMYEAQLVNRAESPAHRFKFQMPLLASVPVKAVMSEPRLLIPETMSLERALEALMQQQLPGAPVIDSQDHFVGVIRRKIAESRLHEEEKPSLKEVVVTDWPAVSVDDHLDVVIDGLTSCHVNWACVTDRTGSVVGIVGMSDLIRGYRQALHDSLQLLGQTGSQTAIVEETVGPTSSLAGRTITQAGWPPGTMALSLIRGAQLIFPSADTTMERGDVLSVIASVDRVHELRTDIRGEAPDDDAFGRLSE